MSISAVKTALSAAALAALGDVPTQFENRAFSPPEGLKWARIFFIPNRPSVNTLGAQGSDIIDGLMQIDLNYPQGAGTAEDEADSDSLRDAFPAGAGFVVGDQVVTIRSCGPSQGRPIEQWWRVSNTVVWEARLRR